MIKVGVCQLSSVNGVYAFKCVSQVALVVKNLPAKAGDSEITSSTPESGRSTGEWIGYSLQYSCRDNPMDRGAWRATVHGVTEWDTTQELSPEHTGTHRVIQKNEIFPFVTVWMDRIEDRIMRTEFLRTELCCGISKREKKQYHMISLIRGI